MSKKRISKLELFITEKCNMNCPWCYVKEKEGKTMTKKTMDKIIKYIEKHKKELECIVIMGGEPMTAPEMVLYLIENAPHVSAGIQIMTNGTIDMSGLFNQIKNPNNNQIKINFSYSPLNKELSKIREKNIFEAQKRGYIITLLSVMTPERIPYIYDYIKYMEKFHERIKILRMHMMDKFWTEKDVKEYAKILPDLLYESAIYAITNNMDGTSAILLPNKPNIPAKDLRKCEEMCNIYTACQDTLPDLVPVDIDGKVYMCSGALGRKEYSYGYLWEEKENPYLIKNFGYQDTYYNYCYLTKNKIIESFDKLNDEHRDMFMRVYYKLKKLKEMESNKDEK